MDYQKRIEDEHRRHAEKIAQLEKEAALIERLPDGTREPDHVHMFRKAPWVTYKVKTLADALALARKFPPAVTVSARESGCLSIQPPELQDTEYTNGRLRWILDQFYEIRQHGGRGFYSESLEFWTPVCDGLVYVRIDIEPGNAGRAYLRCKYDIYGDVISATFVDSPLALKCDARVKFSSGSRDAFDVRYCFAGLAKLDESTS